MAATHYVVTNNPTASDPYTSWATAGTNIIEVVNAALTNTGAKMIWVTNGTYYLSNQVAVSSALTLQSVNGRDVTIVDGNNYDGKPVTNRCFYITASGTVLDGFTIANGYNIDKQGKGGGLYCEAGTTVKNCRITGCVCTNTTYTGFYDPVIYGAGIYITGGVLTNCEIVGNINYNYGASVYAGAGALVANCTIVSNRCYKPPTVFGEQYGAGICVDGAGTVVQNCTIYDNIASGEYGGGVHLRAGAIIRNSLIYGNSAIYGGGIAIYPGAPGGVPKIQNCTVVSNTASVAGGGIFIWVRVTDPATSSVENVISYLNTCSGGTTSNFYFSLSTPGGCWIVNSCIAPTNAFPTSGLPGYYYANNTEANPQFAGKDTGDWRLTKTSPCVNAGTNETWMDGAVDLDLHSRIDRFSRIADMGCYEYLLRGTMLSGR